MENKFFKEIRVDNTLDEIKSKLSLGILNAHEIDEKYQKELIKKYKKSIKLKKQQLNKIREEILNIKRS